MMLPWRRGWPGAVLEAVSLTIHSRGQLRPTDTGSCYFQLQIEEGNLLRKYQVTSARDWLDYGPYSVSTRGVIAHKSGAVKSICRPQTTVCTV